MKKSGFVHFTIVLLLELLMIFQPLAAGYYSALPTAIEDRPQTPHKNDERIIHVLNRLSFGVRPGDFEQVQAIGINAYIEKQLHPEQIDDQILETKLAKLPTLTLTTPAIAEQYNPPKPPPTPSPTATPTPKLPVTTEKSADVPSVTANVPLNKTIPETSDPNNLKKPVVNPTPKPVPPRNPQQVVTELQRAKLLRAVYSERQLNEVMVDFWENHFSIYIQKDADRWMFTEFDREAIRPFTFGRFRDLLGATAHSPAMLYYLDNWQSSVERKYPAANGKPARKTGGINENYARELMELHTLGVNGGYTQKDVQEVARCFTGWTIRKPNEEGLFIYNPAAHDNGAKIVLGQKIPANGGIADAEKVLDILARQPATARFIATKLARRFISDKPPLAVINRAARVFLQTDGSIRETLRAVITSPEFFAQNSYRNKLRSPFEFTVAALRGLNVETDGARPVLDWISLMGQPIFTHITPEGFPEVSSEWLAGGNLLARLNFSVALATNGIKGTHYEAGKLLTGIDLNNQQAVTEQVVHLLLANDLSRRTRDALNKIGTNNAPVSNSNQKNTAKSAASTFATGAKSETIINKETINRDTAELTKEIITLILGSPEFQRR